MYDSLAQLLGVSVILVAGVAWLARGIVSHVLDRDLARHEAQLDSRAATELETLKHQLSLAAVQFEKQTALLQERRAIVIETLYGKLIDFLGAAEGFASLVEWAGEPSKQEKAQALDAAMSEFYRYYLRHKIYFSRDVCERIETLYKTVRSSSLNLSIWMKHKEQASEKHFEAWTKAWETMEKQVPPLQDALSDEFRKILGVVEQQRAV